MIEISCFFKTVKEKFNLEKILDLENNSYYTLLMNGKNLFQEKKSCIIGSNPLLTIHYQNCYHHRENKFYKIVDFDAFFDSFYRKNSIYNRQKDFFYGGLMGFFSYDYKNLLEKKTFKKFNQFTPLLELILYENIEVYHLENGKKTIIKQEIKKNSLKVTKENSVKEKIFTPKTQKNKQKFYEKSIDKIKKYIKKGDAYQVNVSYGEVKKIPCSVEKMAYFCFKNNPASYQGIYKNGDFAVLSTSPERLFRYQNGNVDSCPIKGTIARGKNKKQDLHNKNQLLSSKKDMAELAMIVDLIRNDLYKVCEKLEKPLFPYLLTYENVYHLASLIKGKTKKNPLQVLNALFPGGSISGCPKIRSCEIIDELEKQSRNIYTGSMGYFSFNKTADFNILIRSGIIYKSKIYYRVGGGITLLSKELEEYKETIIKKKTFENFFQYLKN